MTKRHFNNRHEQNQVGFPFDASLKYYDTTRGSKKKELNSYVTTSNLPNSWKCYYNVCIKFHLKTTAFCVHEKTLE